MSKSKISMNKIGKYLREISVVVIGVAITLFASQWIKNKDEKRDITLYLNAVKLELEENVKFLENEAEYLGNWDKYADYLRSHDKKSIQKDSIRGWDYPGASSTHNIVFQTSAFEMFKVSGAMRLMNNKELLRSIWQAYLGLEQVKISLDLYFHLKSEEMEKDIQMELAGKPNPIPLYDFYYIRGGFGVFERCQGLSDELKGVIMKLETRK